MKHYLYSIARKLPDGIEKFLTNGIEKLRAEELCKELNELHPERNYYIYSEEEERDIRRIKEKLQNDGKWFITYSEYYPIYEPAEGGYYYSGKQIMKQRAFQTRRKAVKAFRKWYKDCCSDSGFWCNRFKTAFGVKGKYIGDGYICELTRKPVEQYGWKPYC